MGFFDDTVEQEITREYLEELGFDSRCGGKEYIIYTHSNIENVGHFNISLRYRFRNKFKKPTHKCVEVGVRKYIIGGGGSQTYEIYNNIKTVHDLEMVMADVSNKYKCDFKKIEWKWRTWDDYALHMNSTII